MYRYVFLGVLGGGESGQGEIWDILVFLIEEWKNRINNKENEYRKI